MHDCDCIAKCPFFLGKMENMPSMTSFLRSHFCNDSFMKCARHLVFEKLGSANVPKDLFPNQAIKVEEIISKYMEMNPIQSDNNLSLNQTIKIEDIIPNKEDKPIQSDNDLFSKSSIKVEDIIPNYEDDNLE